MAVLVSDKRRWEKAIEKCKAEKPRVKVLEFGKFEVCGKSGCYTVTWSGKGQEMTATCDCKAGQSNRACYHIPATSGAWKLQVRERAEARIAANFDATICEQCGGLQGGPEADEDHRTCTCSAVAPETAQPAPVADHCCIKCGAFGIYVPAGKLQLCRACFDKAPFHVPAPRPPASKPVAPCQECRVDWPVDDLTPDGVCPDCVLFGSPTLAELAPKPLERWEDSSRRVREEE